MIRELIFQAYWRTRRALGNWILPDIPEREGSLREKRIALQEYDVERRRWVTVSDRRPSEEEFDFLMLTKTIGRWPRG